MNLCSLECPSPFPSTEESQEHADLSRALAQIRNIIAAVDLTVNRHERCQELQEVLVRLENKSFAKLKNDKVFRKQDLHSQHRVLQYKGLVYWKTATGRLKGERHAVWTAGSFELNRAPIQTSVVFPFQTLWLSCSLTFWCSYKRRINASCLLRW